MIRYKKQLMKMKALSLYEYPDNSIRAILLYRTDRIQYLKKPVGLVKILEKLLFYR